MKLFIILLASISLLLSVGCTDSKHRDLAEDFVHALNFDLGYDVEVIKTNTRQEDYILVRDYDLGTIDAYDLSGYTAGDNIEVYLDTFEHRFFYDLDFSHVEETRYYVTDNSNYLDPIVGFNTAFGGYYDYSFENIYRDRSSGVLFSKVEMTPADLSKSLEVLDAIKLNKATEKLTLQFGLSAKRAKQVAKYGMQISKADPSKMTTYSYDKYSQAILGTTFSNIQIAIEKDLNGDHSALNNVYKKAAATNGISVQKVKKLSDLFVKN